MKTFEIEVVRTYTTTIEVEVPDNLTTDEVERITNYDLCDLGGYAHLYDEIWEVMSEKELEQMDVEMLTVKAKEL